MALILDKSVNARYANLSQKDRVMVTYAWVDDYGIFRCKTRTLDFVPKDVSQIPSWSYCWLDVTVAAASDSDFVLKPVALFDDPFRRGDNKIVLCEERDYDGQPRPNNHRPKCVELMKRASSEEPWFGIEQEYTIFDNFSNVPFAFPRNDRPRSDAQHYCGVGAGRVYGRDVPEAHFKACLYAGVKIAGCVTEVWPAQFEYQIGPCDGVDVGDHVWMSRFLLHRVAEDYGVSVSFKPKPMEGAWGGSGGHANFSTKAMRSEGGLEVIKAAIPKLEKRHAFHMKCYDAAGGADNRLRLVGRNQTPSYDTFTWGVADRGASVRIPRQVEVDGCGFLEDRRPAANMDPYKVAGVIVATICLDDDDDQLFQ